jgi:repressor LexA
LREIAAHFRFSSPNAALAHVQALKVKGFVKTLPGRARSLQVLGVSDLESTASHRRFLGKPDNLTESPGSPTVRVVSVPIYGSIPAGQPVDATQEQEGCVLIDVDTLGIKATARTFGLKVHGDSMIGKNIVENDIGVIEHGVQPRSGDVVAALIDGQVTLKTFVLQQGKPYLRAENPKYPKLIPQEELQIQGVMVALVRRRK